MCSSDLGGSYILKEMDGTVSRRGVAAFRLLPYHARKGIPLPIDDLHLDDLDDSDEESWLGTVRFSVPGGYHAS